MGATATCAFCGAEAATSTMDMTGHGWRCPRCALEREQQKLAGHDEGMREHLTQAELEQVARDGGRQAGLGALIMVGFVLLGVLAAGARLLYIAGGGFFTGAGLAGHGLHRRRLALKALREAPTARLLTR